MLPVAVTVSPLKGDPPPRGGKNPPMIPGT